MGLQTEREMSRLPKRFPAGSVYVVEGHGGQYGRLRVSTRYVIMPGGRRVDIPADGVTDSPADPRRGRPIEGRGKSRTHVRTKKSAGPAKKFAVVGGTMRCQPR